MRILINHGQHDHRNLGDNAMLQSCVARLQAEWPDAEIMVVTNSPGRLEQYCPAAVGVGLAYADVPFVKLVPRPARLLLEFISLVIALHVGNPGSMRSRRRVRPRSLLQAIRAADLVVASGGGYITDVFAVNASRVLAVLQIAQSLGKSTAMFSQGLGPITSPSLRKSAEVVFPRLSVLGLREGRTGPDLARSLGAASSTVAVTGDDTFEDIVDRGRASGDAIGVNIRVAGYAGVDAVNAAKIGDLTVKSAVEYGVRVVGLPVSRQPADSDFNAMRELSRLTEGRVDFVLNDLDSPAELAAAASKCRIIVTGSYHGAVFGLAQGIPVICLTKSAYYDGKFNGLKSLFPVGCFVISLADDDFAAGLREAIRDAWHLPISARDKIRESALGQRTAGRQAYRKFRETVENGCGG